VPNIGRLRYLEAAAQVERPRGTLLLLHAFPLNARMWEGQLALADTGWRVIAPQLRGFDGGAGDPAATSVDDYAGDVIDLLDSLHLKQVVVGGLSMGGYVAFEFIRRWRSRVRGLVLMDTRAEADTVEGKRGRMARPAAGADRGTRDPHPRRHGGRTMAEESNLNLDLPQRSIVPSDLAAIS